MLRQNANLRYVANVFTDARAQQQAGDRARGLVQRHERCVAVKHATARKTDNVVQEAERPVQAAILVIDIGIDMAAISRGDHGCAGLEVLLSPAAKFNIGERGNFRPRAVPERQGHKQSWILPEAFSQKWLAQHAGFMRQKLRFNALYAGRLLQRVDYVHGQPVFYRVAWDADGIVGVKIADDAFAAFIDKKRVAANMPVFHGGIAGQDLGIDIAEDHLGRGSVVPRHHLRPQKGLSLQQGTEVVRAEVP